MSEQDHTPGRLFDRGLRDTLRLLRRRLGGQRIIGPACRRCGYLVTGLREPRCPECGADLNKSGVIDPRRVRRWPVHLLILLVWSACIAAVAWFSEPWLVGYVIPRFGRVSSAVAWVNHSALQPTDDARAESSVMTVLVIAETRWHVYQRWSEPAPVDRIGLWLDTAPANTADGILVVDTDTLETTTHTLKFVEHQECRFPDDGVASAVPYSHDFLKDWITGMGMDRAGKAVAESIDEIHGLVQTAIDNADDIGTCRMATLSYHVDGSAVFGHGIRPLGLTNWPYASFWIARAFWTITWIGGIWLLLLRRRRA